MIGVVNINGFIGEPDLFFDGLIDGNTTLLDVVKQVESNKEAISFNVFIDSQGGIVEDGYRIFNYLSSLGKPISTFINGQCFSIATVIFLSGTRRVINIGSQFMIHAPWSESVGDANKMEEDAEQLRKIENDLINFYHKHTGISKAALKSLIETDTFLTPDEAVSLGFATEIETTKKETPLNTQLKAVAYSTKLNIKQMSEQKEVKGLVEKVLAGINKLLEGKSKPVNIVLQDANGVEIDFPDVEQGQIPAVGDRGLIEGAPIANAEDSDRSIPYIIPSLGATVWFTDGAVVEIAPDDSEEVTALKTKISELEGKLTEAQNTAKDAKEEKETMKQEVLGLKKDVEKLNGLAGGFNASDKKKTSKNGNEKEPVIMGENYKKPRQRV